MAELIIATGNRHKAREIRQLLGVAAEVRGLEILPGLELPEESGLTFGENARLKALAVSQVAGPGEWVLADDSGIEVDALGGAPGVYSARYAGAHGDDAANRWRLLRELKDAGVRGKGRRARFRCALALARDGTLVAEFDGTVEGIISNEEKGAGGFGYDPLFIPVGYGQTFGELPPEVKDAISHRAKALRKFENFWRQLPTAH